MSDKNFTKITSSHWGAFEAVIENGKLVSTNSFKQNSGRPHPSYLGLRPNKGASSGAVQGAPL